MGLCLYMPWSGKHSLDNLQSDKLCGNVSSTNLKSLPEFTNTWFKRQHTCLADVQKLFFCFLHFIFLTKQSIIAEWLEPVPSNSRVPGLNTARAAPLKYNLYLMVILWQKIITECTLNRSGSSGLWIDMWVLFPITGRSANVLFKVLKC